MPRTTSARRGAGLRPAKSDFKPTLPARGPLHVGRLLFWARHGVPLHYNQIMLRALISGLVVVAMAAGADNAYQSAARKFALIEEDRAAAGSRIYLSLKELNAYAAVEALKVVPKGLRNPRLELGQGSATASVLVDFLKVRESKGPAPNPLLAWFLSGERPVRVKGRIQSGRGHATVYLDEVRISGITASGAVLDFLIENFFLPFYPTAVIGRPFDLKHRMERLDVTPAGVTVLISQQAPPAP